MTWLEKECMVSVWLYADTTGQFTEKEILDMLANEGQAINIPVPYELLRQWYLEDVELRDWVRKRQWSGGYNESMSDDEEFNWWLEHESVSEDFDTLFDWLKKHKYYWKRLEA